MLRTIAIDLCQGKDNQGDSHTSKEENLASISHMDTTETDEKITISSKRKKDTDIEHSPPNDAKKSEKKRQSNESNEEPKPRIVLTFRSEKPGLKSSNMKIVSTEEKHDDLSLRRSTRSRGGDSDTHDDESHDFSLKTNAKGQSESDDLSSDSATNTLKRSVRCRSKEFSENVLANAIARKEKSYNETLPASAPTQRLSRRIKPTAKILANKELRIGLETQNNARLGITSAIDKSEEAGIQTRRSLTRKSSEIIDSSTLSRQFKQPGQNDVGVQEHCPDQDSKIKKKHLSKLDLKEVDGQVIKVSEKVDDNSLLKNVKSDLNESKDTEDWYVFCYLQKSIYLFYLIIKLKNYFILVS